MFTKTVKRPLGPRLFRPASVTTSPAHSSSPILCEHGDTSHQEGFGVAGPQDESWSKYLMEGMEADVLTWSGKVVGVQIPNTVTLKVRADAACCPAGFACCDRYRHSLHALHHPSVAIGTSGISVLGWGSFAASRASRFSSPTEDDGRVVDWPMQVVECDPGLKGNTAQGA